MNTSIRTTLIAAGALVVGALAGYGYNASLPITVTSTDVTMNAPSGDAALAHAQSGIQQLDSAAIAVDDGTFEVASNALNRAKSEFAEVGKAAADNDEPVTVAQEAVIAHKFTPGPDLESFGTFGAEGASAGGMALTKGRSTSPLALSDYSIRFGDLDVDTQLANSKIDAALAATQAGRKADAIKAITAARGAITFTFNGDQIGEI
ncbi:hypothetical protein [Croceicoccus sediminis]|uniref:hypothetical protein n=1 Tax=Croceicoccus sediminis TaxID=2571150 RepID=UPI0011830DB4|nr:hypothetical protein [Croceicoccus sediminis]